MARTPRGTRGRRDALASVAVVAGVVLALLFVMWAAVIGPSDTLRGSGPDNEADSEAIEERAAGPSASAEAKPGSDPPDEPLQTPWWVDAISVIAGVALVGLIGFLLAKRLRDHRQRRGAWFRQQEDADLAPLPRLGAVADHAEAQHAALDGGTPRNAVVALWRQLEQDVAGSGLPRRPAETSAEYTSRFLAELDVDREAAARLAALYGEARFSRHELTEQHRSDAREALEELHRGLRVGAR